MQFNVRITNRKWDFFLIPLSITVLNPKILGFLFLKQSLGATDQTSYQSINQTLFCHSNSIRFKKKQMINIGT